jgi:hypothetical protein
VRRFLLVLVLAPVLVGFPTPHTTASTNASFVASSNNRHNSFDNVLYWTSDQYFPENNFYSAVSCALNPDKLWPCINEVFLDGRKLEYRPYSEYVSAQQNDLMSITSQSATTYVTINGSGASFRCWAPTWPVINTYPVVRVNEQCSYRQYNVNFNGNFPWTSSAELPKLTFTVRKIKGSHPASHLGFLHSTGPVHEFIPTTLTNEFATVTMSPGFVVGGMGSFNTSLQTLDIPEYPWNEGSWTYGFFLATSNVTGYFESMGNVGFEMLPESSGAWQASNASAWGFFGDYWKPDYAIRVAGPHFKYKANPSDPDELNTAWFTAYMPRALVQRKFGIAPEQANETTLSVTRSVGRNPTQLPSTFTASEKGLLIETDGITFSKPAITISRRVQVKNRKSLSVKNIIASAGIPKRDRSSARISSSPCRPSQKNCSVSKGRVTFMKRGRYVFQVTYTTKDARKRAVQRRHQVTVRVR